MRPTNLPFCTAPLPSCSPVDTLQDLWWNWSRLLVVPIRRSNWTFPVTHPWELPWPGSLARLPGQAPGSLARLPDQTPGSLARLTWPGSPWPGPLARLPWPGSLAKPPVPWPGSLAKLPAPWPGSLARLRWSGPRGPAHLIRLAILRMGLTDPMDKSWLGVGCSQVMTILRLRLTDGGGK